jgi:glycine hydroxymethyltransferase
MADIAHVAGLVAADLYPNPVPHCHIVTTTTHKTLRGPLMHIIAAKAVAFKEALGPEFKDYQRRVVDNAQLLASSLHEHGFRLVSGGTDNHLMLEDVRPLGVTGRDTEVALEAVHITANKNAIPFDPEPPVRTSGVRLGTPAVTTRGFGEAEMREVADLITEAIRGREDEAAVARTRERAVALATRFPLPGVHLSSDLEPRATLAR